MFWLLARWSVRACTHVRSAVVQSRTRDYELLRKPLRSPSAVLTDFLCPSSAWKNSTALSTPVPSPSGTPPLIVPSLFGTHSTAYHHECHSANHTLTLDLASLRVVASPAALQLPPSPSSFFVSRAFATNLASNFASYFLVSNTCDPNGAVSKSVACYMQSPF